MWNEMTDKHPDIVPAVSTLEPQEDGDFLFAIGYPAIFMGDNVPAGLYT